METGEMKDTTSLKFWELIRLAQEVWDRTYSVNEIEPYLLDILKFAKKHPHEQNKLATAFISLLKEHRATIEILQFCMRELQWQGVKEAIEERMRQNAGNLRLLNALQKILDVYSEEWQDADIYGYYRDQRM